VIKFSRENLLIIYLFDVLIIFIKLQYFQTDIPHTSPGE